MVKLKSSILNKEIQYTPEEISLIKKNLKAAFGQEYLDLVIIYKFTIKI